MKNKDKEQFENPEQKHRVSLITHNWPDNRTLYMQALKDYGFGGVVTNVPYENGFCDNPDNLSTFKKLVSEMKENNLDFWIYDENGYPSGYAGGKTLEGHPELEAKGFYMRRFVAYEPRHVSFKLDGDSDKIIWASKYPLHNPDLHESYVVIEKMTPVPFNADCVEHDMDKNEVLFIFCVKSAYEGSHCTHNVCSYSHYINILNPNAIKRFIDLCFEPIEKAIPGVYAKSGGVFTDEPSLQTSYGRPYEVWAYALAPWTDDLFNEFKKEYGFELESYLPYIFEGCEPYNYGIRTKFYELIGKLAARAYSGQLAEWCEAHGGKFSGHYIAEECISDHVKYYGSLIEVVKSASYPGIDVLLCYPEVYEYNTAKFIQMVARKKNTNGMMVEICPFIDIETFSKAPTENMTGVMGLLYLAGVRKTHSYFTADFSSYSPEFAKNTGYMSRKEANGFNEYVGRLGYMLDGLMNDCNTFVYYPLEDVQAKMQPSHTAIHPQDMKTDQSVNSLTRTIYEDGHDFYYADRDDLTAAVKSLTTDTPTISGYEVRTVIIPAIDVIHEESLQALNELKKAGVTILFLDSVPSFGTKLEYKGPLNVQFNPCNIYDILTHLRENSGVFSAKADGVMLIKAKYIKDGRELYFVDNNTRADADVLLNHTEKSDAEIYNPVDGSIVSVKMGEEYKIQSFRGVFVLF